MSKFQIKRACGHEETIQIYGPTRDRARKAEWEESKLCPDCYADRRETERTSERLQAAEAAAKDGLPALEGSQKQLDWALTIRARQLAGIAAYLAPRPAKPGSEELLAAVLADIRGQTSAAWWIDHRDVQAENLLRDAAIARLQKAGA